MMNSQRKSHAAILLEWKERVKAAQQVIPTIQPGCASGLKARQITVAANKTIKQFIQMWAGHRLHEVAQFGQLEIIQIHMRLKFFHDLLCSYLVQIAESAPERYLAETCIRDGVGDKVFWSTCYRVMLDCWDVRGAEWLMAACVEPTVAEHNLWTVYNPQIMECYITPEIQKLSDLPESYEG